MNPKIFSLAAMAAVLPLILAQNVNGQSGTG